MWGRKGGTRKISVWRNKNALSLDDWVKERRRLASTQTGMLEFGAGAGLRRRKRSSFLSGTENCIMPPALRTWPFSPRAALSCVSRSMSDVQLLSLPRVPGKHLEIHNTALLPRQRHCFFNNTSLGNRLQSHFRSQALLTLTRWSLLSSAGQRSIWELWWAPAGKRQWNLEVMLMRAP